MFRLVQCSRSSWNGHVIADVCITPIGEGVSVRKHVLSVHHLFRSTPGLKSQLHAYGTNLEGDWDTVFGAIRKAHESLHGDGVVRISSNLRFGTRCDKVQSLEDKTKNF